MYLKSAGRNRFFNWTPNVRENKKSKVLETIGEK